MRIFGRLLASPPPHPVQYCCDSWLTPIVSIPIRLFMWRSQPGQLWHMWMLSAWTLSIHSSTVSAPDNDPDFGDGSSGATAVQTKSKNWINSIYEKWTTYVTSTTDWLFRYISLSRCCCYVWPNGTNVSTPYLTGMLRWALQFSWISNNMQTVSIFSSKTCILSGYRAKNDLFSREHLFFL